MMFRGLFFAVSPLFVLGEAEDHTALLQQLLKVRDEHKQQLHQSTQADASLQQTLNELAENMISDYPETVALLQRSQADASLHQKLKSLEENLVSKTNNLSEEEQSMHEAAKAARNYCKKDKGAHCDQVGLHFRSPELQDVLEEACHWDIFTVVDNGTIQHWKEWKECADAAYKSHTDFNKNKCYSWCKSKSKEDQKTCRNACKESNTCNSKCMSTALAEDLLTCNQACPQFGNLADHNEKVESIKACKEQDCQAEPTQNKAICKLGCEECYSFNCNGWCEDPSVIHLRDKATTERDATTGSSACPH